MTYDIDMEYDIKKFFRRLNSIKAYIYSREQPNSGLYIDIQKIYFEHTKDGDNVSDLIHIEMELGTDKLQILLIYPMMIGF